MAMAHLVELSDRASGDIRGIYQYIAQHGPANPDSWMAGLDSILDLLRVSGALWTCAGISARQV